MKKKETITERISQIIEKEGHTVTTFSNKLGISWTTANNIVSGKNAPNYDTIVKIIENFGWVDANWLIMGKKNKDSSMNDLQKTIDFQQKIIESQQETIDRLTTKLIEDISEMKATTKKVIPAR